MKRESILVKVNPITPTHLVNHIAYVVDVSGSMNYLRHKAQQILQDQVYAVRKNAHGAGQENYISIYTFNHNVTRIVTEAHPEAVVVPTLHTGGDTALMDAVTRAVADLEQAKYANEERTSFLVVVITDGQENASSTKQRDFETMLKKAQGTDHWSFAFMVPPGGRQEIMRCGVPPGNIQEWETTERGLERGGQMMKLAYANYSTGRSKGITSSASLFTDLSGVTSKDLRDLDDLSGGFKRLKVRAEEEISKFCKGELGKYELGKAFYQLTKSEKIQDHKQILIEDKASKKLYGGDGARDLLGIAGGPGVSVRVKPGNHANFNIFVSSTSMNRKLVRGTDLLYQK